MIQRSIISLNKRPPPDLLSFRNHSGVWRERVKVCYMCICLCGFTCVSTRSFMCLYTPLNSVKLTAQNRNTINCVALQTYLSESHYDGVKWKRNAVSETAWRSLRETSVCTERKQTDERILWSVEQYERREMHLINTN